MKLDILAIGIHPDDVELGCGATLAKHVALGYKVGILDLSRGELGTRGTPETRLAEANAAAKILGVHVREQLNFEDGFFVNDKAHQLELIRVLRKYQPDIVLTNAVTDRHPDHGRAAQLSEEACFYAGLRMVETTENGEAQAAWRPKQVYHYIQSYQLRPDFLVDVSGYENTKMDAIRAYGSQFHNPNSTEPSTFISSPEFMLANEARLREFGLLIGTAAAEGFTSVRQMAVGNLKQLI